MLIDKLNTVIQNLTVKDRVTTQAKSNTVTETRKRASHSSHIL